MSTEYTYNVAFICPETLQAEANQLACIMGITAEDVNTFNNVFYQESNGNKFSVIATVATQNFINSMVSGVPSRLPSHAAGCDRDDAVEAWDSLNEVGGLQYYINTPVQNAITGMGLTLIPQDI